MCGGSRARNCSRSGSRMQDGTAGTSGPQLPERQHLRERGPRACPRRSATPNAVITPIGGGSKPRTGSLIEFGVPGDGLVVVSVVAQAAVQDADESVG